MTSLENLMIFYNSTEPNSMYRSVLRLLLCNLQKIGSLNIYELAELCYTSPSTISRLVRKIGYKNYTQFQSEASSCVSRYDHHNRFVQAFDMYGGDPLEKMLGALEELYGEFKQALSSPELERIAQALHEASRVVIFPYGVIMSENYLQSDLFMSGIPCDICIGDSAQREMALTMEAGETALLMSPDCIDALGPVRLLHETIKKSGARLCTISSAPNRLLPHAEGDVYVTLKGRQSMLDTYIMEVYLAALDIKYRSIYMD